MTFVHGYLLAGLVVLAVPVLIHLLNRQKPQQMPFPAFRFLKLKRTTNRRKMRLQNLLLLLARLLVLMFVIFALARPQLRGAKNPLNSTQPVMAVLIFDTSPSMDYASAGQTRLDDARTRARELLAQFAPESKVRVLETGEPLPALNDVEGWMQGRSLVEGRVGGLRTRPVVESLPRLVDAGVALLARAAQEDSRPRILVAFGDRTVPSWPGGAAARKLPEDVLGLFVDVGIEKPRDLAIESIETTPSVVVPGAKLNVRVTVRATGADFNTELECVIENDPDRDTGQSRQPVTLGDGQRRTYVFERTVPKRPADSPDAPVQIVASLKKSDPLTFNDTAYATVPVRSKRKLLLIADNAKEARNVRLAIQTIEADRPAESFAVTQMTTEKAAALKPEGLQENAVVILHQVVQPPLALWRDLASYVEAGGGLIIIPGGDEMVRDRETFNAEGERAKLLPGKLVRIIKIPAGKPAVPWADFRRGHPLADSFLNWNNAMSAGFGDDITRPQVYAYWEVDASGNEAGVLANYKGTEHPALLEKRQGRGRVVMFTLPLDGRKLDETRGWHNYWKDSWFGQVLLDKTCQDLAGRVSVPSLRFQRGQEVRLALPTPLPAAPFKLVGPGLSDSETRVSWNAPANAGAPGVPLPDVILPQATSAGNYQLRDNKDRVFSAFSVTESPEENNLARVPAETIEAILGDRSLLPVGHDVTIGDKLKATFAPPTELLPLVLLALLALLVLESWLANRYYKPVPEAEEQKAALRPTGELTRSRL
jgi:hypothetical protein